MPAIGRKQFLQIKSAIWNGCGGVRGSDCLEAPNDFVQVLVSVLLALESLHQDGQHCQSMFVSGGLLGRLEIGAIPVNKVNLGRVTLAVDLMLGTGIAILAPMTMELRKPILAIPQGRASQEGVTGELLREARLPAVASVGQLEAVQVPRVAEKDLPVRCAEAGVLFVGARLAPVMDLAGRATFVETVVVLVLVFEELGAAWPGGRGSV